MSKSPLSLKLFGILFMVTTTVSTSFADKIVVAHRGASGYLPEHTLAAKALAYGMGADYIEQDVVMTKDDQLLVLHDTTLDRTTNVAEVFPGRARDNGRHYVIDFTLAEIRQLSVREGVRTVAGEQLPIYPSRFPVGKSTFRAHTLAEEIEMIQGMNKATGKDIGIYPEIKSPEFHRQEGKDLSTALLQTLKDYGYTTKSDKVFVQTFSFDELVIVHDEIMPSLGIDLNLVQLVGGDEEYQWMFNAEGMSKVARFADGFGPDKGLIIGRDSTADQLQISDLVSLAHENGMQVHPYTYRLDSGQVPAYAKDFEDLLRLHYFAADVDGVFTDFPDRAVDFLKSQ